MAVASIAAVVAASIAAEVMASMVPPSWLPPVLAAGGMPTANVSADGDIGSIVVGSAGVGNKITGVPDNRRAFFFWRIASLLGESRPQREERSASPPPT